MVHPKAQMLLLLFAMGHLVGLSPKNYEISPPPPRPRAPSRNHIFTLFYIHVVLHNIKHIYMVLHLYILCSTFTLT
jgi:hypothetical protein